MRTGILIRPIEVVVPCLHFKGTLGVGCGTSCKFFSSSRCIMVPDAALRQRQTADRQAEPPSASKADLNRGVVGELDKKDSSETIIPTLDSISSLPRWFPTSKSSVQGGFQGSLRHRAAAVQNELFPDINALLRERRITSDLNTSSTMIGGLWAGMTEKEIKTAKFHLRAVTHICTSMIAVFVAIMVMAVQVQPDTALVSSFL